MKFSSSPSLPSEARQMNTYVALAKSAVENYIGKGVTISPPLDLAKEFFQRKSGTFVTIEKNGNLRGCIGTYLPTKENIAQEIIYNAIAASSEDYRFGSIRKEELLHLSYTVYILSKPELVKDIKELNPKKFGIIVKTLPITSSASDVVFNGHSVPKSGLLLPGLEGIDTPEQQVSIACQKGDIDPAREKLLIYKFRVEKYQQK